MLAYIPIMGILAMNLAKTPFRKQTVFRSTRNSQGLRIRSALELLLGGYLIRNPCPLTLRPATRPEFHQPARCNPANFLYPLGVVLDRDQSHGPTKLLLEHRPVVRGIHNHPETDSSFKGSAMPTLAIKSQKNLRNQGFSTRNLIINP